MHKSLLLYWLAWPLPMPVLQAQTPSAGRLMRFRTGQDKAMPQASFEPDNKQVELALLKKGEVLADENRPGGALLFALEMVRCNRQKEGAEREAQRRKEQACGPVKLMGEIDRKITAPHSVDRIISTVYNNGNALMDAAVFGIGIYHASSNTIELPMQLDPTRWTFLLREDR